MIQMCHLKALNQVLITFCETAILECTLKVVGHIASWSHCACMRLKTFGKEGIPNFPGMGDCRNFSTGGDRR